MPLRLTPLPDEAVPTKRVTPDDWDADPTSPTHEYVEILVFLRQDTLDAARKEGTRTITERGRSREEMNTPAYMTALFTRQVRSWRLLDPVGQQIPFTPDNLARLPWDIQGWLHQQILNCGGSISTRDLVVRTEDGVLLDYKSPADRLRTGEVDEVPTAGGAAPVQ